MWHVPGSSHPAVPMREERAMFRNETKDKVYGAMMRADTSPRVTAASDLLGRAVAWAVFKVTIR